MLIIFSINQLLLNQKSKEGIKNKIHNLLINIYIIPYHICLFTKWRHIQKNCNFSRSISKAPKHAIPICPIIGNFRKLSV